ncbi:hypothetical protein D7X33_15355 [Butyricicoccus sp. 1XD8-22]|nr:hypothetical protein D7X33_15355 [Butyricicoccus sp. 1XD8-22]
MKRLQKSHILLSAALTLSLTAALSTSAHAFDAGGSSQQIIAAGYDQAGVIDENGALWMWGDNSCGQLGIGSTESSNIPVKVMDDVVSVSAGGYGQGNMIRTRTTAAIRSDGSLWTWGVADSETTLNVLGTGGSGNASVEIESANGLGQLAIQTTPVKILDNVDSVSVGGWCALAIQKDGSLWAWGNMGESADSFDSSVPVKVMDGVASACAGPQCAAGVKTDGSLWLWGYDMMVDDGLPIAAAPTKVMDGVTEVSIGCTYDSGGYAYIAAVKADSSLWLWGTDWGNLGMPIEGLFTAAPVKILDGAAHVSAGYGHMAVLKTDGSLWTWGENYNGQLGNGTQVSSTSPIKVMDGVSAVNSGYGFTLAVKKDGSVWSWGCNDSGELGNGGSGNVTDNSGISQITPFQLPNLKAQTEQRSHTTQPSAPVRPQTSSAQTTAFADVPSNTYYYDAVNWAVEQDVTAGTTATAFSPGAACTRAQTVTFLWRAAGSPIPQSNVTPFADVRADAYYYNAVLWAVEQGITSGTDANTFSPDAIVTRGQTVAFLYRAAGSPSVGGNLPFSDVTDNAYYTKAVQWAVSAGITSGTSAAAFSPDMSCTRAQIVTFLYNSRTN